MWSKVNQKESWWERKTSREDPFAANRRGLRECGDTRDEEVPSSRRTSARLTPKERRAADKALRDGKPKRGKK